MFQSSLKEARALLDNYLPKTADYYKNNRNYSFHIKNKSQTTSLLSPYVRYRLISEEDILKKTLHLIILSQVSIKNLKAKKFEYCLIFN